MPPCGRLRLPESAQERLGTQPNWTATILKPLDTIECRDAIVTADNAEPEWPQAQRRDRQPAVPRRQATDPRTWARTTCRGCSRPTPAACRPRAGLVCYWFEKAGRQIASGQVARAGLVATNSIRGGANRRALQAATNTRPIFEAWSDEPWVIDGAAVRVSLVCFSRAGDESLSGYRHHSCSDTR